MKQLEQSLTEGSLGKKIFLFSLPLMLSNLLQVLFNMADIAVVGKFAGSNALGSVGSTAILVTLFTSFLIGVGGGINVLVALHIGAGNKKQKKPLQLPTCFACVWEFSFFLSEFPVPVGFFL